MGGLSLDDLQKEEETHQACAKWQGLLNAQMWRTIWR